MLDNTLTCLLTKPPNWVKLIKEMKKALGIFILIAFFFLVQTNGVFAISSAGSTGSAQIKSNTSVQNRLEEMKALREQKQAELQTKIQERKQQIEAQKEQKRQEFQARLQQIKDAHKKKIIEKLDASYVRINKRWTTHFLNVLERLSKILDKIKIRAENQNNAAAIEAINKAYSQLESVKTSVVEQSAKTYTIAISDETKLREAAQTVHSQLRSDLQAVREQIKNIRETIHKLLPLLKPVSTASPKAQ